MEKRDLLKLFQQWSGRGIKENSGGGEFKYDIFDIRTFVNATMYPYPDNNKIKKTLKYTQLLFIQPFYLVNIFWIYCRLLVL
jgi:hypothetical protein